MTLSKSWIGVLNSGTAKAGENSKGLKRPECGEFDRVPEKKKDNGASAPPRMVGEEPWAALGLGIRRRLETENGRSQSQELVQQDKVAIRK